MYTLKNMFSSWNVIKWIRMVAWVGLTVQAIVLTMYPMAILGLVMVTLTAFNATPCCSTGTCTIQTSKRDSNAKADQLG
jgi:hypothetical protein